MTDISRTSLFGKLNAVGYQSLESATVFCKMRGNPNVELVHWLHQILQLQDSDLHRIVRHFELQASALARDLTKTLDGLPSGASTISDISSRVEESAERGWAWATLLFGESQIRTGILLIAILKTPGLQKYLYRLSDEFRKISVDTLTDRFDKVIGDSCENGRPATDGFQVGGGASPGEASSAMAPSQMGKQEALARFTVDLTEQARNGEIDNIVGRDEEIRQLVDILMRRRQNNPILTGEAGVGKTAVVEGFAVRIAADDVPPPLKNVTLRTLDVGLLQAGASMKGEFENRLRQVIEEVQSSPEPTILFIDEAHTLIGAGGAAGTGDAANLLKPALARGQLRTIAATTWAEYKKHIEKDPALTRRFQVVKVDEPSEEKAILMMRCLASTLEQHHKVQLFDEAIDAAVRLSHRYIPDRQLPDKAVSLLDTACARVAVSQHSIPAGLEDSRRRIEALETELRIIQDESSIGLDTTKRQAAAEEQLALEKTRCDELDTRWQHEQELVTPILDLRRQLRGVGEPVDEVAPKDSSDADDTVEAQDTEAASPQTEDTDTELSDAPAPLTPEEREEKLAELKLLQAQLEELQGEEPLMLPAVDQQAIASIVADWTGIPVGRMVRNEIDTVMRLPEILQKRIIGQDHAMEMIARRVQTSRANLDNPNKPVGVFMLAGTSGVGKTETALALAETLYGGEHNLITINMSEFQEAHTVSTLKGAPPGYVGYGEGGVLTEAVRRRPYSVVLLDEVEKAHSDVHEIFFQVFDKGVMEDGEGRLIDFRNTLILLTTNAGSDQITSLCRDPELMPSVEGLTKSLRDPLLKVFPAALLGRLIVVPYFPLNDTMLDAIIRLQLSRVQQRIRSNHGTDFTWDESAIDLIRARCTELESGGRMIDSVLTNAVLPMLSSRLLISISAPPAIRLSARNQAFCLA